MAIKLRHIIEIQSVQRFDISTQWVYNESSSSSPTKNFMSRDNSFQNNATRTRLTQRLDDKKDNVGSSTSSTLTSLHEKGNLPIHVFQEWMNFVQEQDCSENPDDYTHIYTDLAYWLHRGSIPRADIIDEATGIIQFKHGSFTDPLNGGFLRPLESLFIVNNKTFAFLLNGYDEPRSIKADVSIEPYRSMDDVYNNNACIREKFNITRRHHGFFLGPHSFVALNLQFPLFSQSTLDCYADVAFPLYQQIGMATKGPIQDPFSWEDKLPVAFWRGATTGGSYSKGKPWKDFHRSRFVSWAKEWEVRHPGTTCDVSDPQSLPPKNGSLKVDIGFHMYGQSDGSLTNDDLSFLYPFKSHVSLNTTKQFKYLIVVDGNTWPNRLQQYLQLNSVILYNGIFKDVYMWKLEPWVHYVPFKVDCSDLEERLHWVMNHDNEAKRISENARSLMSRMNSLNQMRCYSGLLLLEYSHLYMKNDS